MEAGQESVGEAAVSQAPVNMESFNEESSEAIESIEVAGGSSGVSFDELEALQENAQNNIKAEAKKELAKDAAKDELLKDEPKTEAKTTKDDDEAKEAKSDAKEVEAKDTEEVPTEEGKDDDTDGNTYRARTKSGREVELNASTMFTRKVDGQEQEVSLEEALNSWTGHKAVDQRFSQLDQDKKVFLEEKQAVDNTIKEITSLAAEGDHQGALITFFEKALGVDPIEAWKGLREGFKNEFKQMAGMSEAEILAQESQSEANFYKTQLERRSQHEQTEASNAQLNGQIEQIILTNKLDAETYDTVANELLDMKEAGKISQAITPEFIAEVAVYDRNLSTAKGILGELNTTYANDPKQADYLANMIGNGVTVEDVRIFAQTKFGGGESATQMLASKIAKTQVAPVETKTQVDPANNDVFSFDLL